MSVLATDDFNRANANPIGGNWTTFSSEGAMQIVSNAITPASVSSDSGAWYNAIGWPNDQYSQLPVTILNGVSGAGLGPAVRVANGAQTYYRCAVDHAGSGNVELVRAVAGSHTTLWTRTATFVDGDLVRLEVQGSTLRAFIAGVQVGADFVDGSPITSGNAGIAFSSGSVTSTSGDNWEGGDLAAATTIPYNPQRSVQTRDPGEAWWIQKDRRNAILVAPAANDLAAPLLVPEHQRQVYAHSSLRDRRMVPQQPDRHLRALDATVANDLAVPLLRSSVDPDAGVRDRRQTVFQRVYSDPSLLQAPPATMPAPQPTRTLPSLDYSEAQWLQAPRRDPLLLTTAQLENELLGGAETDKRTNVPASHAPRWWMPQQPAREGSSPGLLDDALLESPLLRPDPVHATVQTDRREVPQQRPYISDPSFYPTAGATDPLTVAWGAGGTYWHLYNDVRVERRMPQQRAYISDPSFYPTTVATDPLTLAFGTGGSYWLRYNTAALFVDRREVPQQRQYESDPTLLLSALLENELLGSADDLRRRYLALQLAVRSQPQQLRAYDLGAVVDIPTGADTSRRYLTPLTHADRRAVPQQPRRITLYFDAGPASPPLTLAWGVGGSLWHVYNPRRPARSWWPTWRVFGPTESAACSTDPLSTGSTVRPNTGTTAYALASTARPNTGVTAPGDTGSTEDPC